MTDIIARLRSSRLDEAADEIERLKAEMDKAWTAHVIEREDLKTEIVRLRAVLERIADDGRNCADHCRSQARRALEP